MRALDCALAPLLAPLPLASLVLALSRWQRLELLLAFEIGRHCKSHADLLLVQMWLLALEQLRVCVQLTHCVSALSISSTQPFVSLNLQG